MVSKDIQDLCPALVTLDVPPDDRLSMLFELIKQPNPRQIQLELIRLIRKVFSIENSPPLAQAVTLGVSIVVIDFLQTRDEEIKLEAA